ncbi:glycosyltransferase [Bacillus sp. AFS055030]|uniref:glycosyltransferase n=1 Tax=Bacillus sp. AFS055030 TaxID=2033507 RepID=UPI000BFC0F5B|nr:glycosyltransferase [Bacillus sp. AFS055030]PGL72699.1 hypothetical protein CN925_03000 [Bacillus sp. AFS055030]
MKIMMVITGMQSGGAERVMATLCNELSKRNQVRLLVMKEKKTDYELKDNIEFVAGNVTNQSLLKSVRFVRQQMDDWQPQVVLSFMTKSNLITLLAKKMAKWKAPVIIAERANPNYTGSLLKVLRKFVYPSADGCVFQTKQAQKYYNDILNCNSIVLRNPLNPNFKVQLHQGVRTKRIVSVGRLSVEKNQRLLIESFSKIAVSYPEYSVEIFGEGPLRNELQSFINKKNLQSQVRLMGRKDNIQEYISDAEIFVLPSNSEGMPNALLEAMALGMACIATDCPIGGPAVIIENKKNGILVPMNESQIMADTLELLIGNDGLSSRLRAEAKKVVEHYDTEKVCAEWETYIRGVVSSIAKNGRS